MWSSVHRFLAVLWLLLAAALGGCTTPVPAPASQAVDQAGRPADARCEPGKEGWRVSGPSSRGGAATLAVTLLDNLDVASAGGRALNAFQVYDYLVQPRACFWADTVMMPSLAKSWAISPDGLTWTVKLRDDVHWQDRPPVNGRLFTASDVAWTIEYVKQSGVLKSYLTPITHEEPDPYTVILHFKEADADFLAKLGDERNVMLPHEVQDAFGDFKSHAIGTGPFTVVDYKPDQYTAYERSHNYYQMGADGRPLPYLDGFRALKLADYVAEVAAVRSGQLDRNGAGGFQKLDADALRQALPRLQVFNDVAATTWGIWMNLSVPPWNNGKVRQALSLAINRDDVIGAYAGAAVYAGFVPATIPEYAWSQDRLRAAFTYDPARAAMVMAQAGVTFSGQRYEMISQQVDVPGAEVVAKALEPLGITTKITPTDSYGPLVSRGVAQLAFGRPGGGGRFTDFWLGDLLRTGASRNVVTRFSDPAIDPIALAQGREMNPDKRKQIVEDLQQRLVEAMPYVPLVHVVYYHTQSCRLRNINPPHQSQNHIGLAYAWVGKAGC